MDEIFDLIRLVFLLRVPAYGPTIGLEWVDWVFRYAFIAFSLTVVLPLLIRQGDGALGVAFIVVLILFSSNEFHPEPFIGIFAFGSMVYPLDGFFLGSGIVRLWRYRPFALVFVGIGSVVLLLMMAILRSGFLVGVYYLLLTAFLGWELWKGIEWEDMSPIFAVQTAIYMAVFTVVGNSIGIGNAADLHAQIIPHDWLYTVLYYFGFALASAGFPLGLVIGVLSRLPLPRR